jgi:hypothetical protein
MLVVVIFRGSIFFQPPGNDSIWLSAPLSNNLNEWLSENFSGTTTFYRVFSILLLLIEAVYLNYILIKHNFFYKNSYLPALFYVLVNSLYPAMLGHSSQLLAAFFLIVVLDKLFSLYDNENAVTKIIDAGIFTGFAALFSFDALIFLPFVVYSVASIRPFKLREVVLSACGLFIPFYILAVVYYLKGDTDTVMNAFFIVNSATHINAIAFSYENLSPLVIALPISIVALFRYQSDIGRNNVKTRKIQNVVMVMLLFSIASAFFAKPGFIYSLPYISIPLGIVLSYYFLIERKKGDAIKEIIFAALSILIIALQILRPH